ncbi:MAG TPA: hypothetical protein VE152_00025, partial [Acidimicrobiales bacterium]|nr:hypothetical protein [Acidimicrobiales bacterium]
VELGSQVLTVSRSKGRLSCHARRRVRGVVLRTEELDLDTWLGSLARGLADEARRSAATRTTLQSLLT